MASTRASRSASQSSGTDPLKGGKVKCTYCPKIIDNSTQAMSCDTCENWVCLKCTKISQALYAELTKPENVESKAISWNCSVCKSMAADLRAVNSNILDLKRSNEERLGNVETKLATLFPNDKPAIQLSNCCRFAHNSPVNVKFKFKSVKSSGR